MKATFFAAAASTLWVPAVDAAANVIDSGTGFGTYYYDLENPTGCSNDFNSMNGGVVECNKAALTLDQVNSNNLVAMNHTLLASDLGKYCGKKVIVSVNGVASSVPFFIGDGCERCGTGSSSQQVWNPSGAPGLDFSLSQLSALNSDACAQGHIDISWEITDETIFNFDTNSGSSSTGAAGADTSSAAQSAGAGTSSSTQPAAASMNTATQPAAAGTEAATQAAGAGSVSATQAVEGGIKSVNPPAGPETNSTDPASEPVSSCRRGTRAGRRSAKMRARKNL